MDGDIFQIVLARSTRIECPDPVKLYRKLRSINPSPYTYLFEFGDLAIVGASPETLFNTYDRKLRVNPIAGTCPRGRTREEDDRYAKIMLGDEKERAEHVMLVDLGRNDVRSVCRSGTVQVDDFMSVLKYSHVQHIETTVSGELREECDQFDAARSVFPAGTLSGAPKLRAMEIIDDLEGGAARHLRRRHRLLFHRRQLRLCHSHQKRSGQGWSGHGAGRGGDSGGLRSREGIPGDGEEDGGHEEGFGGGGMTDSISPSRFSLWTTRTPSSGIWWTMSPSFMQRRPSGPTA